METNDYLYAQSRLKLRKGEYLEAKKDILAALKFSKNKFILLYFLALIYHYEEIFDKSIYILEYILKYGDFQNQQKNVIKELLSYCYLGAHQWINGWDLFYYRKNSDLTRVWLTNQRILTPWNGENLSNTNKNLLVVAEEGIGDELVFGMSMEVLKTKVDNIYFECDPRLRSLYKRTYPEITFINRNNKNISTEILQKCNYYVLLGDLPHYLNPEFKESNMEIPLVSDKNQRDIFRNNLLQKHNNKTLVGIFYHTSAYDAQFRMPPFEFWDVIFRENDDIAFINLQENHQTKVNDKSYLYNHPKLYHQEDIDLYNDLDGLSALIDATDFVISIGNYGAHLSGRLKKKLFIILSNMCNSRWRLETDDHLSLWYPTAKLIKYESFKNADPQIIIDNLLNF